MRCLFVTRRNIPLDRTDEYLEAWDLVCREAARLSGHAWLFRAAEREDTYLEFVEWQSERSADLPDDPDFLDAQIAIDEAFGPGQSDQWLEA